MSRPMGSFGSVVLGWRAGLHQQEITAIGENLEHLPDTPRVLNTRTWTEVIRAIDKWGQKRLVGHLRQFMLQSLRYQSRTRMETAQERSEAFADVVN